MTNETKTGVPDITYDRRRSIRLLLSRLKEQKNWLIFYCVVLALSIFVDVMLYKMIEYFTDGVIAQIGKDLIIPNAKKYVLIVIGIMFAQGALKGLSFFMTSRIGQKLIMKVRQEIFDHLQILGLDFFESRRTGQVMSWVTSDVLRIREFTGNHLPTLLKSPFAILAYIGVMLYYSWQLTLAALVILPFVIVVVQIAARRTRKAAQTVQQSLANVSGELQEGLTAIEVIRSFANEIYEISKFSKINRDAYKAEIYRAKIEAVIAPVLNLTAALGLGILLLFGAFQVAGGQITAGQFIMIIALLHRTNDEANKLGRTYMALQDTLAASDRIFSFLDTIPSVVDPPNPEILEKCDGFVEFKNVKFKYPTGDTVLENIDIKAEPGKVVAIVGPSGAGKSTIAKLIPRFYEVTDGAVTIDGHDIRKLSVKSLRSNLGIVPQETVLFHGSVRENIAYGKL
ncbi:MAG: ABC transporter ATP-binding protein, partial [bacterium]